MEKHKADYTNVFLGLTNRDFANLDFFELEEFQAWEEVYKQRLKSQTQTIGQSKELMRESNPAVIPRNYLVEEALGLAVKKDDYSKLNELVEALVNAYNPRRIDKKFMQTPEPSLVPYKTYCRTS